eukprot:621735-Alexandrium_andersonii.AAC.3
MEEATQLGRAINRANLCLFCRCCAGKSKKSNRKAKELREERPKGLNVGHCCSMVRMFTGLRMTMTAG